MDKKLRITKCNECKHAFNGFNDSYFCGLIKQGNELNLSKISKDCPLEDY